MEKEKRSKVVRILTFILIFLIIVIALFFSNKRKIVILISHLSHKNELKFVEQFLNDFKKYEFKNQNIKKYFLDDKAHKQLEILMYNDKYLQKRDYIIGTIGPVVDCPNITVASLATKEKGKIAKWIEVVIIKKNVEYYIKGFQLGAHFPRPPNEWD